MLVTEKSTEFFAKKESGGKGFHLYLMSRAGLPVPEWVVVGKAYYQNFIRENNLTAKIQNILDQLMSQSLSAKQASDNIHSLITSAVPSSDLIAAVKKAATTLPQGLVSVRSSAADEDSLQHSFAGQLSSFLYVQGENDILKYILECWASAFTERGLVYRIENKVDLSKIAVSVVIQRMIDPEKSGVLFTCDPVMKSLSQYVVSSVYGVGEGLVGGTLDADSFYLNSENGSLIRQEIVTKNEKMVKSHSGHCSVQSVASELQDVPSLSERELADLYKIGKKIHHHFRRPQDVEWAIQGGKVYLLQTRPVTNLDQDLMGYPNLWDNSNIVESYGGLTLPLSFSFALRNYRNVYIQFCEVLGVPNEVIKDMDSYLGYMLGSLNGRVYYNLFNWYKLVGVLPGFKQNREFMETMMGVSEKLSDEIEERIKPHPSWGTFAGRIRKFVSGLNFIKYHFTIQSMVDDFLATFQKDYDRYRHMPLRRMRGDQLIPLYMELERNMLGRWKAPIINDFLCMVHFGLLRKLTLKWCSALGDSIQNELIAGEGGLESAEPMKALLKLAVEANKNPELRRMIENLPAEDLMEAMNQSAFKSFYASLNDYMDRFGFRCMSEMKLEEIDLHTDPSYLFVCLKNYLKAKDLAVHDDSSEKTLRENAEKKVAAHLSSVKCHLFFWVLKHARKAVKNRENTRFARTRAYGLARTIFQTVGEELASLSVIDHPRDIFWITLEEVFGLYNGTLPDPDIKSYVAKRKLEYGKYEEDIDARILTRGVVYVNNRFIIPKELPKPTGDFDLSGLPCSPGVIEGIVKVIINPQDNLELNGEILVTARTDPGWVPLYPSISGLIVERGSLLSHSAVVAREMGIPAVVSVPGLMKTLKTGMRVRIDGQAGTVKILQ